MNRATALAVAFCLFALATVLGWLNNAPTADSAGKGVVVPEIPRSPLREGEPITPQDWRAKIERSLAGNNLSKRMRYSGEEFEKLFGAGAEIGGKQSLLDYVEGWVRHDPSGACAWLETRRHTYTGRLDAEELNYKTSLIFDAWAKLDPAAALTGAVRLSIPDVRSQALVCVLLELRKTDPAKAREAYVQHISSLSMDDDFTVPIGKGEAARESLEFLQSLPEGKGRRELLATAMKDAALGSGLNSAAAFWKNSSRAVQKEILAGGFVDESHLWGPSPYTEEIRAAFPGVEELRREMAETGGNEEVFSFLLHHGDDWARRDLAAAVEWTRAHARGMEGIYSAVRLFGEGTGHNFEAARAVWESLPGGVLKAEAVRMLLKNAGAEHQAEVEALVGTLSQAHQSIARRPN